MDHPGRAARVGSRLEELGADALLVTNLTNVRYLTGFAGSNGQVLVAPGQTVFMTDPRYAARAADLVEGAEIAIYKDKLTDLLPEMLGALNVKRLGVEGATMSLAQRDELSDKLAVELVATAGAVEDLRRVKERVEIELIRAAADLADQTFAWALDHIAPGVMERDVALELEMRIRKEGAEAVPFEPIVGSGQLSAHIHHTPSERVLSKGDLVLLDFGAQVGGYCSDLTRTVVLGPASEGQTEMYELVLGAQNAGLSAVAAGVSGKDADAAARGVIETAGHGEDFGHGAGHGVGLEVHEAPRLARTSEDTLRAGDVVTVEPGVYVTGRGGVRIEDCVLVTDEGAEVLGSAPKNELMEL
jgi:Xaa-Pro aminopeptidase